MRGRSFAKVAPFVGAAALVVVLGACKSTTPENAGASLSKVAETWCPEHFEVGPSDTCFAIPEHATKDTPVVVYLHGTYQGHALPEDWAAANLAVQRGFAVVVPRGKRDLCAWRAEYKDHLCWPEDPEDTQAAKNVVNEWERVLWQVDALLEGGTHKRYVLGSSKGGSFASFLAMQSLFPAQAYAVVNGGPMVASPSAKKAAPMLLVAGQDSPEQMQKVKTLHDALAFASWPHAFCPRAGSAALSAGDVETALRFFRHDADGNLKPQNGAYPCGNEPAEAKRSGPTKH